MYVCMYIIKMIKVRNCNLLFLKYFFFFEGKNELIGIILFKYVLLFVCKIG